MTENALFERLQSAAEKWRAEGWHCQEPLIGEILRWQFAGDPADGVLKFLRWPQFRALEVYWMLRLQFGTPHIMDLYKEIYAGDTPGFIRALGVPLPPVAMDLVAAETMENKIRSDDQFVKKHGLDALREAAILPYPSYIFALTMGAGKTILIAAVIATEFAMALRRPERGFMQNALVFAPGKTILGSLREIAAAPYADILPPESYRQFNASAKIIHPRDGDPEIHAAARSSFNIIITNTEKIRLQANVRRGKKRFLALEKDEAQKKLEANLRLQKITSLPNLGVFSDEAHHTYGNKVDQSMKRVRATVNHIAAQTDIVAVVNTTGTPYHKRDKPLAEVVSWYGIGQGIMDDILKKFDVREYDMSRAANEKKHISDIIRDFFADYGEVALPNGARAKIAFFFKRIEHLNECQKIIANEMVQIGQDNSQILVNTQKSDKAAKDEFAALNDPASRKRVILLVGIGTEGWDCPSLFATALIKGKTTGIFALQAATRCLRQVRGNRSPARMYLHTENFKTLSREMVKVFGLALEGLTAFQTASRLVTLRIRKVEELPKLKIVHERRRIVRALPSDNKIRLKRPPPEEIPEITVESLAPNMKSRTFALTQIGKTVTLRERPDATNPHAAAAQLAANYHLPALPLLGRLRALYPDGKIPLGELRHLARQVEEQVARYEEIPETVTEVMALIRVMDDANRPVFRRDETGGYFHTLRYTERTYVNMRIKKLFAEPESDPQTPEAVPVADSGDISFHYAPYNFDSGPERIFFERILGELNLDRSDIRCFLFTGGLTGTAQTDFFFEYKGADGRFHRYHPDFVIVRKSGEFLIVEVKAERDRNNEDVMAKERAVRRLENIQPDKIQYNIIIYSADAAVSHSGLDPVLQWISG